MLQQFLKTTLRNLGRNRVYGILNILGLATGIACAALIFLWVEDELHFDSSVPNKNQIYWVRTNQTYNGVTQTFIGTPGIMAPTMKKEFPQVADVCREGWGSKPLFARGDQSVYESGFCVDSSFLTMFGLHFLQGSPVGALRDIHSIVISEKMAEHFFPAGAQIVGKTLRMDNKQDFVVTGVVEDQPENATIQFDWLGPYAYFKSDKSWLDQYWGTYAVVTYIALKPGTNVSALKKILGGYIQSKDKKAAARAYLFSMHDWHLRDEFVDGKQVGGRIDIVHLFSLIAWIVLAIACINFMNLATARSEQRAKEVGVRKVMGALRTNLVSQFMLESLLLSLFAAVLGMIIVAAALPVFNTLVEKHLSLSLLKPVHLGAVLAITLVCGLLAGSYPALYLSSFNPVRVFKGMRIPRGGATLVRKGLVVFQFTISIGLIVGTILVYQQVMHIKNRPLGYDKEHLIDMEVVGNLGNAFHAIRQDLLNTGVVENAGLCSDESLYTTDNGTGYTWDGMEHSQDVLISGRSVSPEYFSTMGMHRVEGRTFLGDAASDAQDIIITQKLAKMMGKGSALGKTIGNTNSEGRRRVIGVVQDYVYGDMYGQPDPVIFSPDQQNAQYLFIRYKATVPTEEALAKIGAVLKKDNPAYPFEYNFIDQEFDQLFKGESLMSQLSKLFAALAIFISCLGLLGLSAFTAERRTREIGIRKVMGASVQSLAALLSTDFLKLVCLSALIAFPLAWWLTWRWSR